MAQRGKFIVVFGPTGSGKSVLLNYVYEYFPNLVFPSSYTTRERRPSNENSSYKFLSTEEFENLVTSDGFLEWAQYGANYYGTPKDEVLDALVEGKILLKEIEVQGVRQIQEKLPGDVVLIYIDAGSWEELEQRIRARAPISEEELEKRKKRYEDEVTFKDVSDFVIANPSGKLEEAKAALKSALTSIIADSENEGISPRA